MVMSATIHFKTLTFSDNYRNNYGTSEFLLEKEGINLKYILFQCSFLTKTKIKKQEVRLSNIGIF